MTDHTYACNSLTNFEEEEYTMTGNGNHVTCRNLHWKIREMTSGNLWRFLAIWNHCAFLSCLALLCLVKLNSASGS